VTASASDPDPDAAAQAACPEPAGLDGVGFLLGAAHRAHRRAWEARIADLGVTAPRAAVLRLVASGAGHGVRDLAHLLATDPMNAQRIIDTLITAELCESGRDPHDARRRPIRPTALGTDLAREVTRRALDSEAELLATLGEAGYCCLLDGLRTLIGQRSTAGS
jgi:DNA-binding MarR family transcriptional regulator